MGESGFVIQTYSKTALNRALINWGVEDCSLLFWWKWSFLCVPAAAHMQEMLVTAWRSFHLCICLQCTSVPGNLPVIWGTLVSSPIKKHGKRGSRAGLLHALCMCQGETSSTVVGLGAQSSQTPWCDQGSTLWFFGFSLSPWVEIWALKHCQAVPVPAACLSSGLDRLRSWSFICIVFFSLQIVLAVGELANLFSTQMSSHSQNHCAPVFCFFFPSCQGHGAFWDFFLTAHSRWALVLGIPPAIDQCPVALQEQAPVTPSVFAPWAIKPWALHTCIFVDRYQYWKITCYVAWLLWGGEVARTWFLGVAADGCASSFHDIGGEIQDLEHCMRNQVYISK